MKDARHPSELTPRQLWMRIVKRARAVIRECRQIIIDTESFNGQPRNAKETPLDCEDVRVMLHQQRKQLADFLAKNPRPPRAG